MIKFEIVEAYKDKGINLPKRGTKGSAGYDIEAAEKIIVPNIFNILKNYKKEDIVRLKDIDEIKSIVKSSNLRTMIPTGLKVKMPENVVLKIYPRSSTGANCLLQLANQTGIIDSDYYNADNEGHIFIPIINLSPYDIIIDKGEKIAQGIFEHYLVTDDDEVNNERTGGFGSTDLTKVETSSIPSSISTNDYKYDNSSKIINAPDKQVSISYIKETTTTTGSIPKYNKSKSHNKKK